MAKKKKEPVMMVKVLIDDLNIRKGPGFDHERTGKFAEAGEHALVEIDGDWGRIAEGWILIGNPEFVEVCHE